MMSRKKRNCEPFNASQVLVPITSKTENTAVIPYVGDTSGSVINAQQVSVSQSASERKIRVDITIQQKRNICAALDNGKSQAKVAQKYKVDCSTVRKIYSKKKEWQQLVHLGYGNKFQYHPPLRNREVYQGGLETVQVLRESLVSVTKSMMVKYFNEVSDHFRNLTDRGQQAFWLRFCKWANISVRRVNGCTQLLPVDAEEKVRNWKDILSLMNADCGGYKVIVHGDETPVAWEPVANLTYEFRGTKRVKICTTGKERNITTCWM